MTKKLFPSHQFQWEIIRQMSQRFLDPHHNMSTKSKQFVPIWDLVNDKELVNNGLLISMSILRDLCLYTRLVSFARIEPMLNPILVEPTTLGFTLHKEFISPPFTKTKQTKQINIQRGQNGHFHCPFPCFIFHLIIFF